MSCRLPHRRATTTIAGAPFASKTLNYTPDSPCFPQKRRFRARAAHCAAIDDASATPVGMTNLDESAVKLRKTAPRRLLPVQI